MKNIRPAAVAGMFYPEEEGALRWELKRMTAPAPPPSGAAPPKALIVPHAGYIYSGPVAATGYARLRPVADSVSRVVVLGPSHRVAFHGLAVPVDSIFRTPLGDVTLDTDTIQALLALPQVHPDNDAHRMEHSIEVHLPFLQEILDSFVLVPIVVGRAPEDQVDAVLQALGLPTALDDLAAPWLAWAAALDRPQAAAPQGPPAPTPPLAARPRRLSVTRVETWMRDPYDLYAEKILGLQALDALDADPGAADFGTLVHAALESYLRAHPERLPADPEAALLAAGRRTFDEAAAPPAVWAFWWPRYRRLAAWMAERERAGRPAVRRAFAEVKGRLTIAAPGGDFELTATADRIDRLGDGRLVVLDYKTGGVPGKKEIELGFAPQLPLEAAIAAAGGFEGPGAAAVARLEYWKVNGAEPPGFVATLDLDPEAAGAAALDGLARRIARFDDPATPYAAKPWPKYARRYSDYRHLAREKEWSSDDGAGDDS